MKTNETYVHQTIPREREILCICLYISFGRASFFSVSIKILFWKTKQLKKWKSGLQPSPRSTASYFEGFRA